MFGKIKNKLKNMFNKNEELFEEENEIELTEGNLNKKEENIEKEENLEENKNEKIKKEKNNEKKKIDNEKDEVNKEIIYEKENEDIEDEKEEKKSFFKKHLDNLKTKNIDEESFEKIWVELEIFLLEINIAFEIVQKIERNLKNEILGKRFNRFKLKEKIKEVLINTIYETLKDKEKSFLEDAKKLLESEGMVKLLILGVNGTGKTTTIAKLVKYLKDKNYKVVVACSDTFRAAANEQLEEHSKKVGFKLIKHKIGSDPAAVAYDAIEHAKANKIEFVIIDTAGRMPNNHNLIMELQKIKKVSKANLVLFVGDSISGNDLIEQIESFNDAIDIDGVILTKVDIDERPGSVVTTAYSIDKPIYFLGTGQNYEDLIEFDAELISKKLFDEKDEEENDKENFDYDLEENEEE